MIGKLFSRWTFRSSLPVFQPGEVIHSYLTGFDPASGKAEARIGDSILEVSGARADQVETLVHLQIESFDTSAHRGQARLID